MPKRFQHTAARRRLARPLNTLEIKGLFQHTAARRRLGLFHAHHVSFLLVSTHSRPKAAGGQRPHRRHSLGVSTHSRPKAAGSLGWVVAGKVHSFNTQPPEGGWHAEVLPRPKKSLFQHTAARRRLESRDDAKNQAGWVSTHSRPKAAGQIHASTDAFIIVSTHSRPKAAGRIKAK